MSEGNRKKKRRTFAVLVAQKPTVTHVSWSLQLNKQVSGLEMALSPPFVSPHQCRSLEWKSCNYNRDANRLPHCLWSREVCFAPVSPAPWRRSATADNSRPCRHFGSPLKIDRGQAVRPRDSWRGCGPRGPGPGSQLTGGLAGRAHRAERVFTPLRVLAG